MPWRGWVLCAAASLLWLLVGCVPDYYWPDWGHGEGEVVPGSPAEVSATLQTKLTKLGVFVRVGHDGDAVRVESMSRAGRRYTLLLYRAGERGDQTRIRIVWEKEPDETFWLEVLGGLRPGGQGEAAKK